MSVGGGLEEACELLVERRGETIALLSPGVGLFVATRAAGDAIGAGAAAGALLVLGRPVALIVPPGVEGRVSSPLPALARQPVGWGDVLYEIRPLERGQQASRGDESGADPSVAAAVADGAPPAARLLFRSPQSGRFYLRPSPSEEPFVEAGAMVEEGQPVGLIEVMKTFAHVRYAGVGGLPRRARVARILVEDGAEVGAGDALIEVEPVPAGA